MEQAPVAPQRQTQVMDTGGSGRGLLIAVVVGLLVLAAGAALWLLAPEAPAPPPLPGTVRVTMASGWAWIEVDGARHGQAPGTLALAPGTHNLRFAREGFQPQSRTLDVVAGSEQVLELSLAP